MTVIFHTNAGAPVLAGDMLLSISGPNGKTELRLPSQPKGITIPADKIPDYIPIKMRRKIFVVNDRMAVGAAGSVKSIRKYIDDLTFEFGNRNIFTNDELRNFLDQYGSSKIGRHVLDEIGSIILAEATDWRGSLTSGLVGHGNVISKNFGRVIAIGTGSGNIIDQVQKLDNSYEYGFLQPPDGEANFPEFRTLASNLMLLARVYWNEFISPGNLFEGWGGAYDLIYQDSNKVYQYLNEYTIFHRVFDVAQADKGIQLMNVLKYERRRDISFIAMTNGRELDFFGAKDITASDTLLRVNISKGEFSMNSKVHISIIAVGKENRYLAPLIQIDGLDPADQAKQTVFTQFDEEGRLRILFHAAHDEWLTEQVMSHYQKYADKFS